MTKEEHDLLKGIESSAKFYGVSAETALDLASWIRRLDDDLSHIRTVLAEERVRYADLKNTLLHTKTILSREQSALNEATSALNEANKKLALAHTAFRVGRLP